MKKCMMVFGGVLFLVVVWYFVSEFTSNEDKPEGILVEEKIKWEWMAA